MFVFYCVRFSFSVLSQEIACEECLQNDIFCVGWDAKTLTTINQCHLNAGLLWHSWTAVGIEL